VAVGKLAMRGRESLGLLRVYENVLALHTMLWPEEIRSASGVAPEEDVTIRDAELDLADTLMETLGDLDWSELHDEYRAAVEELVAAKLEGVDTEAAGKEAAAATGKGQVVDLMAVLESSVQAARQSRGEGGAAVAPDATVHELSRQRGARKAGAKAGAGTSKKAAGAKKTAGGKKTASTGGTASKKTAKSGTAKPGTAAAAASKPAKKTAASKKAGAAAKKTSGTKKAAASKKTARPRKSA
jgi:DNA end-binding protein Ku